MSPRDNFSLQPEQVERWIDAYAQAWQPNGHSTPRFGEPIIAGNRVAVEWWAIMRTQSGDRNGTTTQRRYLAALSSILRFARHGRCAALREYWNADFGRELTVPPGWGV